MAKRPTFAVARIEKSLADELALTGIIRNTSTASAVRQALEAFVEENPCDENAIAKPQQREWTKRGAETKGATPLSLRIDNELAQKIRQIAWRFGVPVSTVVRQACYEYVQRARFNTKELDEAEVQLEQQLVALRQFRKSRSPAVAI